MGKQVKAQRNRRGMKQIDLAKDVELTGAHISDVENGMSTPTIQSFEKLCDKLDVSPDVFLVDSNDMFILYAIETYLKRVKETP
ncbi:MAG: helix-turn-helix domain-containing protein [Clostridiales bacterium]|nr:helix-turn-helix domain-containing protein [Clostridiales bacterium]